MRVENDDGEQSWQTAQSVFFFFFFQSRVVFCCKRPRRLALIDWGLAPNRCRGLMADIEEQSRTGKDAWRSLRVGTLRRV